MMPVRQKRKTARKSPNILAYPERTVRNHMAEERDTYEARADYRRNLAGTMRAQKGNHGLKSPRRLGAANGLPVRW
jgi:hypothetical protein